MTYERVSRSPFHDGVGNRKRFDCCNALVADYTVRQRAKSDPVFLGLDDKWMFTRTYFERIRNEQGWAELVTYALNVCPTMLRNQAEVHLKLGAQLPPSALPDWAWTIIDETDAAISDDLRREWAQGGHDDASKEPTAHLRASPSAGLTPPERADRAERPATASGRRRS